MIETPSQFISNFFSKGEYFFMVCLSHEKGENFKFPKHYLLTLANLDYFNEWLKALNRDYSIYFTPSVFKAPNECILSEKGNPRKIKENVKRVKALILDFDEPSTSQQNLKELLDYVGVKPTYILETSVNKFQVCFMFENSDIDKHRFEIINKTIATHFKSDTNVCSMEKLFRLPFLVNKKNDFKTRLLECDFGNKYNFSLFENLVLNDKNMSEIAQNLEEMGLSKKVKSTAPKVASKPAPQKQAPRVDKTELQEVSNIEKLDKSLISKYGFLLKKNNYDASVCDVIYINFRKNKVDDFELVWQEILWLRDYFKHPLKRDIRAYKTDRESVFSDGYGRER